MVNVPASPCRVLLIDDDPGDAHLVRQMLRSAPGGNFEVSWASSLGEARQHLQKDLPEILLLDLSLPDSTGLATVHASRQAVGTLPLIVLTGHDDNALALQTLEAGAQDYLVKGSFDAEMLTRAIRYAISRSRLEARLHDAEERWRFALEGAGDGVWDWNLVIDKIEFSPRLNSMLGLADGDIDGSFAQWLTYIHPDDLPQVQRDIDDYVSGRSNAFVTEHRTRHADGSWRWILARGMAVKRGADGRPLRMIGTQSDISERKAVEENNRLLIAALEAVANGVVITDTQPNIIWVNQAFEALTGFTREEAMGRRPAELVKSGLQDEAFYADMWGHILAGKPWRGEVINKRKDGSLYHEELLISPVFGARDEILHFVGSKQDITERKRLEAELLELATTDTLTSLPNRRNFMEAMQLELARLQRLEGQVAAVLMFDLDHFKRVNDRFGHAAGDAVLRHFSGLLRKHLRRIDKPGRIGGEEFAVILPGADRAAARSFAERLRQEVVDEPLLYNGQPIPLTVSIGVSLLLASDAGPDAVLGRADNLLYLAKANGRNRVEAGKD